MSSGEGSSHSFTVEAATENLGVIRRYVADAATGFGADPSTVSDIVLAASELATNVVLHTAAPTITAEVFRIDDAVVLDVLGADGLDHVGASHVPSPDARSGRGLALVAALMDEVDLVDSDDGRRIRCIKRIARA